MDVTVCSDKYHPLPTYEQSSVVFCVWTNHGKPSPYGSLHALTFNHC